MQVFISWSGPRSRAVAELFDEWIQCVIQAVTPWMSSKDIDRGSLWFSEIHNQLRDTKLGVVCLTKDNKDKPWILFEAGALAKGLTSSRVCTLLVDLETTDISDPLAQFNHTAPDKEGIFKLTSTINAALEDKRIDDKVFEKVFETYWPQFRDGFKRALEIHPQTTTPAPRAREDKIDELLRTVRALDRRIRSIETAPRSWIRQSDTTEPAMLDYPDLTKIINELVREGMPDKFILSVVNQRAPRGATTALIREERLRTGIPDPLKMTTSAKMGRDYDIVADIPDPPSGTETD